MAIIVPSNTPNPLSLCTRNSRWDWWTERVRPSSVPTVNERGATGANLCVSSPLVWHQKHGTILAETVPALQQDPGILLERKESSRKSAKFNSQTGQVDFLIRSLFYAIFTLQNAPSRLRSHTGCSDTSATSKHSCKTQKHFPFSFLRTQHKECP